MRNNFESGFRKTAPVKRKKKRVLYGLLALAACLCIIPVTVFASSPEEKELPPVVIRVDDIQDYAFKEGQVFLLDESGKYSVPFSYAVIPGKFGEDSEILQAVGRAAGAGSEITVHGWIHEDFFLFSFEEQESLLSLAKTRLHEVLDCDSGIFVPPMFKFNENTFPAIQRAGYSVFSSSVELTVPGLFSGILSLPGTVNLSSYSENSTWNMKNVDSVLAAVAESVGKYGFAVIVTHPQEFLSDGVLKQNDVESFRSLLESLKISYSLTTFQDIAGRWPLLDNN